MKILKLKYDLDSPVPLWLDDEGPLFYVYIALDTSADVDRHCAMRHSYKLELIKIFIFIRFFNWSSLKYLRIDFKYIDISADVDRHCACASVRSWSSYKYLM